jgi:hypothetical protein
MDAGTHALDVLTGHAYPLDLGFIGVVNRSQQGINADMMTTSEGVVSAPAQWSTLWMGTRWWTRRFLRVRACATGVVVVTYKLFYFTINTNTQSFEFISTFPIV